MNRKSLEPALLGVMLLTIIVLAAYPYLRGSKVAMTEMSDTNVGERQYLTDLKKLRDRFNQDKGKVRLILLLSPT